MKAAAEHQELTVEERNLLSVAYKNVFQTKDQEALARRTTWRVISTIEQKGDADKLSLIQSYKRKIETELEELYTDSLNMIEYLIPNSESEVGKGIYFRMKGDYLR